MPRSDDLSWLDDETAGQGDGTGEPATLGTDPVAMLQRIAESASNEGARVSALRLLIERGDGMRDEVPELIYEIAMMDDAEVDKELVGFFNPGYVEPVPLTEDAVREEARRMVRVWAKQRGDEALAFPLPGVKRRERPAPEPETPQEPTADEVTERRAAAQRIVREQRARQAQQQANGAG